MDVISSGVANKAAKSEKDTRNNILGLGIEGVFPHVKGRIDSLEAALQGVVNQANKLMVNDSINIMKANAKFNAVAKTLRYKHQNMVFEDFLDASGVDAGKSTGYTLDITNGLAKASGAGSYTVVTTIENTEAIPEKAILVVEEYAKSNLIALMTSNNTPSGTANASSEYSASYQAWEAFNGILSTGGDAWLAGATTGWLAYNFQTPKVVNRYNIYCQNTGNAMEDAARSPKSWTFEGSNDGINWTVLDSRNNITSWIVGTPNSYECNNTISFNRYRINITANGGSASYLAIAELEMENTLLKNAIQGTYSISRDGGTTFEPITPETLFYFQDRISPKDTKLVLKAELPANVQLLNYGLTWS